MRAPSQSLPGGGFSLEVSGRTDLQIKTDVILWLHALFSRN